MHTHYVQCEQILTSTFNRKHWPFFIQAVHNLSETNLGTRQIMHLDELSPLVPVRRWTSLDSKYRCIIHLVPVLILNEVNKPLQIFAQVCLRLLDCISKVTKKAGLSWTYLLISHYNNNIMPKGIFTVTHSQ